MKIVVVVVVVVVALAALAEICVFWNCDGICQTFQRVANTMDQKARSRGPCEMKLCQNRALC